MWTTQLCILREAVLAGHLVVEVGPGQVGDVGGACLGGPRDPVPGVVVPGQGDALRVVELPPQPWLVSPQGGQEYLVQLGGGGGDWWISDDDLTWSSIAPVVTLEEEEDEEEEEWEVKECDEDAE